MKVNELIQDIQHRIGEYKNEPPYHHASVLRMINRVYRRINIDTKCLEKILSVPSGTFSDTIYYIDKPEQMIMPYRFTDDENNIISIDYVQPELWSKNNSGMTFTILGINQLSVGIKEYLYFTGVDESTSFTIWYFASGNKLVDKDNPGTDESNEPEWPDMYHDALYYGTAIELKHDYPMYQNDVVQFQKIKSQLKEHHYRRQMGVTPEIMGGIQGTNRIDDYDVMGQR